MELKVIATSKPIEGVGKQFESSSLQGLGGRYANVCYMAGTMDEVLNQSEDKALKRAENCSVNTHHSVFDHISITASISSIPKALAMLLNSFKVYGTSEKSARYCEMRGLNNEDQYFYLKWIEKLTPIIKQIDPTLKEGAVKKLAMENARYFISIFSPTTEMIFTTNIKDWNYFYQMLLEYKIYIEKNNSNKQSDFGTTIKFYNLLLDPLNELLELIFNNVIKPFGVELESKKVKFNKLPFVDLNHIYHNSEFTEEIGYNYIIKHDMSFACLGHKERSRTLNHSFCFTEKEKFYIPNFIRTNIQLVQEWEEDMRKVQHLFPQGMIVTVIESGSVEDFFKYQVTERICNRVFYETCFVVWDQAVKIQNTIKESSTISKNFQQWVSQFFDKNGELLPKCVIVGCSSPCGKRVKKRIL